jgi:hypothetical protein
MRPPLLTVKFRNRRIGATHNRNDKRFTGKTIGSKKICIAMQQYKPSAGANRSATRPGHVRRTESRSHCEQSIESVRGLPGVAARR